MTPPRRPERQHDRWAAPRRRRARAAGHHLLGVVVTAVAVLALALARAPGAGADADTAGYTAASRPGAEGDGGALAVWIVAEVVILVVGVVALRLWFDRRPPSRPRRRDRS